MYKCTPSELDEQDEYITDLHFQIMMLERKKEYLDMKRQEQKSSK